MRLDRLVAQIRKEVLSVLRDPRTRAVLIGPPLLQLFVFAFAAMFWTYLVPRDHYSMLWCVFVVGVCQGVFALFTMYLPPLFPTLLRTTGAGFCYNIGRIAAAFGTVYFGKFGVGGDYQLALYYTSFLFIPAAIFALLLPELPLVKGRAEPVE